ncbi:hypothetical protein L7F22_049119 [Adiantum nelumboides]|nr:hypothetical protein [Adiantum nelumboides]
MQRSTSDMESFTGLVPSIYSLFQKKKMKNLEAVKPRHDQFYENGDGKHLHVDVADKSRHVMKATNLSSDWRLVRQSSIDHLISRSTRNSSHLDVNHYSQQSQAGWNSIPHYVYVKLKKKMRYSFFSSSSSGRRQHRCNTLTDSARFEGS